MPNVTPPRSSRYLVPLKYASPSKMFALPRSTGLAALPRTRRSASPRSRMTLVCICSSGVVVTCRSRRILLRTGSLCGRLDCCTVFCKYAPKSKPGVTPSLITVTSPDNSEPAVLPLHCRVVVAVELTPGGYLSLTESALAFRSKFTCRPTSSACPPKLTLPPPVCAVRLWIVT